MNTLTPTIIIDNDLPDDDSSSKSSVSHSLVDSDSASQNNNQPTGGNPNKVYRPRQATLGRYKMQQALKGTGAVKIKAGQITYSPVKPKKKVRI